MQVCFQTKAKKEGGYIQDVLEKIGILPVTDSLMKIKASFIIKFTTKSPPFLTVHRM